MFFSILGCTKYWEDHYNTEPETVDKNVWEAIQADPELSAFVDVIKQFKYDSLFLTDNSYTIFIPDNDALNAYLDTGTIDKTLIEYHISEQFIQSNIVSGQRLIQTLGEKYALLESYGNVTKLDGFEMDYVSPLYRNGKYYKMNKVAVPKPNLYEYIATNNPILKRFIDEQDSLVLDREKSRPTGFDEFGNTVYDTVSEIVNLFEIEYFPVKHEFRSASATIAFPVGDVYNNALTVMAEDLGGTFIDYNDIPYDWQEKVLIPNLLYQGVFDNRIEEYEFLKQYEDDSVKLRNVLGDSVGINYLPSDKVLCSNGYAYSYSEFEIPDSLYSGSVIDEAEWLLRLTGINKYSWKDYVTVTSDASFEPIKEYITTASNDSIIKLNFPKTYNGQFELDYKTKMSLFPRKYLMIVRTHMDIGGIYNVYVNDELVKTIDYYDYLRFQGLYFSVNGDRVRNEGRFNYFDCWVESIWEYGQANIRFEYVGPGFVFNKGLVIDYVEFVPETSWVDWPTYIWDKNN